MQVEEGGFCPEWCLFVNLEGYGDRLNETKEGTNKEKVEARLKDSKQFACLEFGYMIRGTLFYLLLLWTVDMPCVHKQETVQQQGIKLAKNHKYF